MKHWLTLAAVAVVGSMVGVAVKLIINNHTAAAQPATTTSPTGA